MVNRGELSIESIGFGIWFEDAIIFLIKLLPNKNPPDDNNMNTVTDNVTICLSKMYRYWMIWEPNTSTDYSQNKTRKNILRCVFKRHSNSVSLKRIFRHCFVIEPHWIHRKTNKDVNKIQILGIIPKFQMTTEPQGIHNS